MLQNQRLNSKFRESEKHYERVSQFLVDEPAQDRKCTDIPCLALFFIMLLVFISIGTYSITEARSIKLSMVSKDNNDDLIRPENLIRWGIGIGSTVVLSFLFLVLVKLFPKQIIYSMVGFTLSFLFSLTILGYFMNNLAISILSGFALLIYTGILVCFWKVLKMGIFVLKFATDFLTEKPSTLILPIIKVFLTSITALFFFYSLSSLNFILDFIDNENSPQAEFYSGLYTAQVFIGVGFIFVFYYMMNYVLAFVCANWYYGIQGSKGSIKTGYKNMFKQTGSLVFGSLMITLSLWVRFLFSYYNFHERCNCCICLDQYRAKRCDFQCVLCCCCSISRQLCNQACFYLVRCFAQVFQVILQVLGNYTVIMMSISGQPYMEASKSVIGLAHNYFGFLGITNFMSLFITVSGVMVSVVLPSFLIYVILDYQKAGGNTNTESSVIIGSCFLISLMVLELIIQSICSLFVLYCMDKDFVKREKIVKERLQQQNHKMIRTYSALNSEGKQSIVTRNDDYQKLV